MGFPLKKMSGLKEHLCPLKMRKFEISKWVITIDLSNEGIEDE